jgi:hypothetical protein
MTEQPWTGRYVLAVAVLCFLIGVFGTLAVMGS